MWIDQDTITAIIIIGIAIAIFLLILHFRGKHLEKEHLEEKGDSLVDLYYYPGKFDHLYEVQRNIKKYLVTKDLNYLKTLYTTDQITEQIYRYLEILDKVEDKKDYDLIYKTIEENYSKLKEYGTVEEIFEEMKHLLNDGNKTMSQYLKNVQPVTFDRGMDMLSGTNVYYGIEYNMPYCPECTNLLNEESLSNLKCSNCNKDIYEIPQNEKRKLRFYRPLGWAVGGVATFFALIFAFMVSMIGDDDRRR